MDVVRYLFALLILAWSLWYIIKPVSVIKGGQLEKHLYKRPNRTRIIWAIRIIGIVGIGVAGLIAFSEYIPAFGFKAF